MGRDRIEGGEHRWRTIGLAGGVALLVVAHTARDLDEADIVIRIISARRADPFTANDEKGRTINERSDTPSGVERVTLDADEQQTWLNAPAALADEGIDYSDISRTRSSSGGAPSAIPSTGRSSGN